MIRLTNIARHGTVPVVLFFCLLAASLYAAPVRFFPITVTQPDGAVLHVFVSGDEYQSRMHDAGDYTIVRDPANGYFVFAVGVKGELRPSRFIVGSVDPASAGLVRGLNIPPAAIEAKRTATLQAARTAMIHAPTAGIINNLVVFIRFGDEPEFSDRVSAYDSLFNAAFPGAKSMYAYFHEASYGQLSIFSAFLPLPPGGTIVSYKDPHPRAYYQPYDASANPGGYQEADRTVREHTLLRDALNSVSAQIPPALILDGDGDGNVDNVCFVASGGPTAWSSLLWPHMWGLYSYNVTLNGKRVGSYNFQLRSFLIPGGAGVLCHEMFHTLGAPDLYHYSYDGHETVGPWDLMEQVAEPPEHMGAYMKYRYGHWIPSLPVLGPGTYSLNPLTSSENNCCRINSPYSTSEYFVLEYRKRSGNFEAGLPGDGLLVYRINGSRDGRGNADGPPDEVYLYRPGGTPARNGVINSAFLSGTAGRPAITDAIDPFPFLADGSTGGLSISGISAPGSTITFTVQPEGRPVAGILSDSYLIPVGGTINFLDRSSGAPATWDWHFPGAVGEHSSQRNPKEVVYQNAGRYPVSLTVANAAGADSVTRAAYVTVVAGTVEDFERNEFPPTSWTGGTAGWDFCGLTTTASGYDIGRNSVKVDFYNAPKGAIYTLTTDTFPPSGPADSLRIDFAYAAYQYEIDRLDIEVSSDGGGSYATLAQLDGGRIPGIGMVTAIPTSSRFSPTAGQWMTKQFPLPAGTNTVRFRVTSDNGNTLYLDNIAILRAPGSAYRDQRVLATAAFRTSVTNVGHVGALNAFGDGTGFVYHGANRLYEAGLVAATDAMHVPDAFRTAGGWNPGFSPLQSIQLSTAETRTTAFSVYSDEGLPDAIGITVLEHVTIDDAAGNNGYAILDYAVVNRSGTPLEALSIGGLYDFDMTDGYNDRGVITIDSTNTIPGLNGGNPFSIQIASMHASGDSAIVGIVPVSQAYFDAARILINAQEVYPSRQALTDSAKRAYITSFRASNPYGDAGKEDDHGIAFGFGPFGLASGDTARGAIALVTGTSMGEIVANARRAQSDYVRTGHAFRVVTGVAAEPPVLVPDQFALVQNYPNPFNPSTTIGFTLPREAHVLLEVYTILGQRVAVLVNGVKRAGTYTQHFDATGFSSGVYFYRLTATSAAGGFSQTRKLVVVR